jgi:D-sedoheptulose 7-phosphate isomerase
VASSLGYGAKIIDARIAARARMARSLARRSEAGGLLAADAQRVACACYAMSERFHRGGKLIVFGAGSSSTDAQHLAVEFLHPVIVGKRSLPAIALNNDVATITGLANARSFDEMFTHQIRHLAAPEDIAISIVSDTLLTGVLRALATARERNLLTIAMTTRELTRESATIDFEFVAHSDDPMVANEIQVTTYHVLWELVHVFLEHPGVLGPGVGQ